MQLIPADTGRKIIALQCKALSNMSMAERAEMTFQLSDNIRSITEAGIQKRHPDYSSEQIKKAVLSLVLDRNTFKHVYSRSQPE